MKLRLTVFLSLALGVLSGCYHATIETGLPPSNQVITKSFASGWIYGLVPPSAVETMAKCPNGVAKVETQLSFVNQLVAFLTLDIYTPMEIKVTCAEKATLSDMESDFTVPLFATDDEIRDVLARAARISVLEHRPVFVERFPQTP